MTSFSASLRTIGDRKGLPATVHLDDDRLRINAGDHALGEWPLSEIHLEPIATGYRLDAEVEQILIELEDTEAFEMELHKKPPARVTLPSAGNLMKSVDGGIDAAERRLGDLLPEWVFTRIMFGVVIGILLLTAIVPGLVSTFLLIAGLLTVVVGAVAYTDTMLASKWLPGRMTPMHVLLAGVVILVLGVFLGILAN